MTIPPTDDWYGQIVADPLVVGVVVAVFAALIGVAFTFSGTHLYRRWEHRKRRASGLMVLRSQLQNHIEITKMLGDDLGQNRIVFACDPSPIDHFLDSDIVDLSKDEKLVSLLYEHLGTTAQISRALDRIDMATAASLTGKPGYRQELEENLKKLMPDYRSNVEKCLEELQKLLG